VRRIYTLNASNKTTTALFQKPVVQRTLIDTVEQTLAASRKLDRTICLLGLGAILDGLEMKKACPIASWDS
jgi:hypothetical protein